MPAAAEWAEIVHRNVAVVTSAALRVLGCVSDAEDVAQEVFLEAFRKWDASESQSWAGLLRRMAVCRALDVLRARKKRAVFDGQAIVDQSPGAEERLLNNEEHAQLRAALKELSPREAEVFCLACYERQSHQEIAELLRIERSAVAVLLSRAKSKLTLVLSRTSGDLR